MFKISNFRNIPVKLYSIHCRLPTGSGSFRRSCLQRRSFKMGPTVRRPGALQLRVRVRLPRAPQPCIRDGLFQALQPREG